MKEIKLSEEEPPDTSKISVYSFAGCVSTCLTKVADVLRQWAEYPGMDDVYGVRNLGRGRRYPVL